MRKLHDIVPGKDRIKKAILCLRLHFWIKGFVACSRHDDGLQREIDDWPDGFALIFQIYSDKPNPGLIKGKSGLHIIKVQAALQNEIRISFKSLDIFNTVISGRLGIRQAYIENRIVIAGHHGHELSVIRAIRRFEGIIFKSKSGPQRYRSQTPKRISRIVILKEIFRKEAGGKEGGSDDSQILRVS